MPTYNEKKLITGNCAKHLITTCILSKLMIIMWILNKRMKIIQIVFLPKVESLKLNVLKDEHQIAQRILQIGIQSQRRQGTFFYRLFRMRNSDKKEQMYH